MEKQFRQYTDNTFCPDLYYTEKLYNDSYDFKYFKDNFLKSFKNTEREQVKKNLDEIYFIYVENYACFDGFFDSAFDAFFRTPKLYQKIRQVLKNKNFNKKQFWGLGIL